MMPMQNSLAERLSGIGMQPPGPAQPAQTSPQSPQSTSPQSTMAPLNNTLARPFDPRMMPGQAPVMLPQPVRSGPLQMQPQAQPQMQAQPMQNNLRRMMAY